MLPRSSGYYVGLPFHKINLKWEHKTRIEEAPLTGSKYKVSDPVQTYGPVYCQLLMIQVTEEVK